MQGVKINQSDFENGTSGIKKYYYIDSHSKSCATAYATSCQHPLVELKVLNIDSSLFISALVDPIHFSKMTSYQLHGYYY